MTLMLNGEPYETEKTTVARLLDELKIIHGRVAVEINLEIIKKAAYETHVLHEGDTVEVVNFVGGGVN